MIENITIRNFKSIHDQPVNLKKINVLVGQNGAGKSNFISLFHFLERLSDQQLESYIFNAGGIETFLYGGYEKSNNLSVYLEIGVSDDTSNTYEFEIEGSGDKYQFKKEYLGFWDKSRYEKPYIDSIGDASTEAQLKTIKTRIGKYVYSYLKGWKVYHFHDTSENAKLKSPQDINDNYFLNREAENIAPFLFFLREKYNQYYLKIVDAIRLVYPMFHDFVLTESGSAKGKIELRWSEKGSEHVYLPKQISDGTLRFICLATLLIQPHNLPETPRTIILDEPELGLHPFAIHVLSELIKKASLKRQIIIATQSVTLINEFDVEDLIITERNPEGETIFKRKNLDELSEWLEDFSLGELFEKNFLGGRP